jgi:putative endonuclease
VTDGDRVREAYVSIMSNRSHRLYIGLTTDLVNRVREHKEHSYPNGFTARYNFDRLVDFEVVRSHREATKRERYLKGLLRAKKVAMIQKDNPKWRDLSVQFDDLLMAR